MIEYYMIVCQWLNTGLWFSWVLGFSTNKTDLHNTTEILLKMQLTIPNFKLLPPPHPCEVGCLHNVGFYLTV